MRWKGVVSQDLGKVGVTFQEAAHLPQDKERVNYHC